MNTEMEHGNVQRAEQPGVVRAPPEPSNDDEINLLDYWRVIWARRWLISGLCIASVLTAMIVSLLSPKIYESTASIMLPTQEENRSGLSELLSGGGGVIGTLIPGMPATSESMIMALLKSRSMAEDIVRHFDLVARYDVETMQEAVKAIQEATKISLSKDKVIQVTVEAKDAKMAADISNFYVGNLDRMNRAMNLTAAKRNRIFVDRRLAETHVQLAEAEEALKAFQLKNKAVALDQQAQGAIEAAATIQAQITASEVEFEVLNSYLTLKHPDLLRVQAELDQLRKQLRLLEYGEGGKGQLPGDRMHPAWITVPPLALEFGRLMREYKVQEEVYKLLTTQLEQAKIQEVKEDPAVQILDPAIQPEFKSKPKVKLNMMIAGILALFLGIFLAFFSEYLQRIKTASRV